MVMEGGNGIHAGAQAPTANLTEGPDASRVAREFVRQYYTILHNSPVHLHRFYNDESEFTHGSIDTPSKSVRGQQDIHRAIVALNFQECYAKIHYVDAQESENKMVVVQVAGQLTNRGAPMRRFMQTFILVQLTARKYYVRNDIFRYQDQVFDDEEETDDVTSKVGQDDQAHEQPIFNGSGAAAATDHVTLNGEHAAESAVPAVVAKEDNQWDNSMAAQTPATAASAAQQQQTQATAANAPASTQSASASTNSAATAQETSNASSAPRSWSQMVQVKTSDPVTPPTSSQPSFGPPANSTTTTTFGGPTGTQRPPLRGNNNNNNNNNNSRTNGSSGPSPPKKDLPPNGAVKDDETSPNSKSYVPDNQQLFVGNIPLNVSEKTLMELFSKYGKVQDFRLNASKNQNVQGSAKTNFPNFGFVIFDSFETVQKVLEDARNELTTWEVDGKQIRLNIEEKKPRSSGGPKGPRNLNNGPRGNDRRPMPNGGGGGGGNRRDFNGRGPRSGPPRQNSAGGGPGNAGPGGPAHQHQLQQQQHPQAQH